MILKTFWKNAREGERRLSKWTYKTCMKIVPFIHTWDHIIIIIYDIFFGKDLNNIKKVCARKCIYIFHSFSCSFHIYFFFVVYFFLLFRNYLHFFNPLEKIISFCYFLKEKLIFKVSCLKSHFNNMMRSRSIVHQILLNSF